MPLATKNGSLIVNSGSIAEDCNCCSRNWYCCPPAACIARPSSVSVAIAAQDYYAQYSMSDHPSDAGSYQSSAIFLGNAMNGTRALTRTNLGSLGSEWSAQFSAVPAGCAPLNLRFVLGAGENRSTVLSARMYLDTTTITYYDKTNVLPAAALSCSVSGGDKITGGYFTRCQKYFQWSKNCPGTSVVFSHTFAIEGTAITVPDARTVLDAELAATGQGGGGSIRGCSGYLAARRNPGETYSSVIKAVNSRSSNNLVTVTFTITE